MINGLPVGVEAARPGSSVQNGGPDGVVDGAVRPVVGVLDVPAGVLDVPDVPAGAPDVPAGVLDVSAGAPDVPIGVPAVGGPVEPAVDEEGAAEVETGPVTTGLLAVPVPLPATPAHALSSPVISRATTASPADEAHLGRRVDEAGRRVGNVGCMPIRRVGCRCRCMSGTFL